MGMLLSGVVPFVLKERPGAPSPGGRLAGFLLTLVPFLTLMLIGAVLERTGLEPALGTLGRILPNHPWRAAVGVGAGWVPEGIGPENSTTGATPFSGAGNRMVDAASLLI